MHWGCFVINKEETKALYLFCIGQVEDYDMRQVEFAQVRVTIKRWKPKTSNYLDLLRLEKCSTILKEAFQAFGSSNYLIMGF